MAARSVRVSRSLRLISLGDAAGSNRKACCTISLAGTGGRPLRHDRRLLIMGSMFDRDRLHHLIDSRAIQRGDFTLASGRKSKYYCDSKQITLHAEGLRLVAQGMFDIIRSMVDGGGGGRGFDAVGGMSLGADPIVGGVLTVMAEQPSGWNDFVGFIVRKEAKDHGTQKFIEGPLEAGTSCIIVEDVVTTGGSSLKAIERVEAHGCSVAGVIAILDRMEGGRENFESKGYPMHALFDITDFGFEPPATA